MPNYLASFIHEYIKFNDLFKNLAGDHIYISLGDGCFITFKKNKDKNQVDMEYNLPINAMNCISVFINKWSNWRDLTDIQIDFKKKFISILFGNYFNISVYGESIIITWTIQENPF